MDNRRGFLKKFASALAVVGIGVPLPEPEITPVAEVAAPRLYSAAEFAEDGCLDFGELMMQEMGAQFKKQMDEVLVSGDGFVEEAA